MIERTPNITPGHKAPMEPRQGMSRSGLSALEGTKLQGDGLETLNEQVDYVLRELSKQERSVQERFVPGKPREISRASFPEGVKAANRVFSNRDFNQQMGITIGKHRGR